MDELEFIKKIKEELFNIKILGDKEYKAHKAHELIFEINSFIRQKEKQDGRNISMATGTKSKTSSV